MYAPLNLHVSHAGETSGTGSWHHPLGRRRRRYDQPTAIRRHQIHGTGEPHCRLHFIRLFHVRDPIQGAGSLSGISRDRCERLAHRYRVVRMAQPCASAACSRQLAVASCAFAQHSGHSCTRASSDGLAHRMHSFHGADHSEAPSDTREEHPRHLAGCHPHCVPAPPCSGLARPAGVSLRRPRSAVENVADLRGSRCGPHGSQMHVCGVSRVGPSRVRFVSDRVRARARGSRGPCEVRGDDNADRPPSFPFTTEICGRGGQTYSRTVKVRVLKIWG